MNLKTNHTNFKAFLLASLAIVIMLAIPITTTAQNGSTNSDAVVADFMNIFNTAADKITQLGDAMPYEKYSWRPAEGIRSVKESMMHVASANYFFGSQLGATMPEGLNPQALEKKEMSKEEAVNTLKESISFAQNAITNLPAEQMDETVSLFGNEFSKRQVMFLIGDHVAEHLGQLIAYARMNGVVPPWSQ